MDLGGVTLRKPIIGMVHLRALPGAPGHDAAGGIDAVLFGNEHDRPYLLKATPESLAAMAAVVATLKPALRVPFGVNYLWDPVATVALACATGAAFAREIFTGVYASDMGSWAPDGAGALRLRAALGRHDLTLLFNVNAEFATPLDSRPVEVRAKSAVFSSLADAICVSGPMTGQGVDQSDLERVKRAVGDVPVLANTGVTIDTVAGILRTADGCVVGTHFKIGGVTWNPVDGLRVLRFMDAVRRLR
ncbi:MAG: BtpA/SgcQ family protein [SAR202 cluster bacterium]|nr:BtpA/SgcQ family protein [SAR202 cluster bacterium]